MSNYCKSAFLKTIRVRQIKSIFTTPCAPPSWPRLWKFWQWQSDPASDWIEAPMGPLPYKQQESPDECFREGSETRPNFSLFFFFQTSLSMGNFPRTTPLLFYRDVCPLRTLWVVFLKAKGRGKKRERGGGDLVIHQWRLDDNKIHDKIKWDESTLSSLMDCVECMCAFCLLQYFKENWSNQGQKWT